VLASLIPILGKAASARSHEAHAAPSSRMITSTIHGADSGARIFRVDEERALRLWQLTPETTTAED